MWLVAVGLLALVCYLGRQSPGPAATTTLPPDDSVPVVGASPVPSPALTGANPYLNATNKVTLKSSAQYVATDGRYFKSLPPAMKWARLQRSVVGGNYMTDADSQLMTQNVPPIVKTVINNTNGGQKI